MEHPRARTAERANDIANTTLSACLNTGYAAAVLEKAGHDVNMIEGYMKGLDYNTIYKMIAEDVPEVLGIHIVYNWDDHHELFDFIKRLKWELKIPTILAYGYYPTFSAREILNRCLSLDYILYGEFEQTIVELLENLDHPETVRGLALRDPFAKGGVRISSGKVTDDLDSLPFPVRTDSNIPGGQANILGSRGCYGNCSFCYINPYYNLRDRMGNPIGKWRPRSPENIVAEIDEIRKNNGVDYFYFTDPNFYGPGRAGRKRVLELAELLKTRNIRFGVEARANDIDEETTKALVDAGLEDILVGLESGRDESLERLNKHTTVADNEKALRILRENGIDPAVGFIMFEPDSTLEDLRVNLEFLKRNQLLDKCDRTINVLYHHQILLKGTQSYKDMLAAGELVLSPHSDYEAFTTYKHADTGALASVMRKVTNRFFDEMVDSYEDYAAGKPETVKLYDQVNDLLVRTFENGLDALMDTGLAHFDPDAYAWQAIHEMESLIQESRKEAAS